jgi:hypothetical protein
MKPVRVGRWLCALVLVASGAAPAQAAWDNVFQVCCWGCRSRPIVDRFRAAYCCPAPVTSCAPPVCCTTQYVQRSYYQPVTCYQTQTYYEPVTSYRTSYYYEPVTSYRYSCYYDPCTCSYQQIACPTTCYRLRSQTCAVTSYLQRTCQVPVTSYRLSYYLEPVTTCSSPCPTPCATPAAPGVSESPGAMAPGVTEQRSAPPTPGGEQQKYYQPPATNPPPTNPPPGSTSRQVPPAPVPPPPTVRLDRIVAVPTPEAAQLQGQVVSVDNLPRSGIELTFVRADRQETRQPVTADTAGNFHVQLPAGGWLVYMTGRDGKPVYHSEIQVRGTEKQQIVLVSR